MTATVTHGNELEAGLNQIRRRKQWVQVWLWALGLGTALVLGTVVWAYRTALWEVSQEVLLVASALGLFFLTLTGAVATVLVNQTRQLTVEEKFNALQFDVHMAVVESLGPVLGRFGNGHASYTTSLNLGESLLGPAIAVSKRMADLQAALAVKLPHLKLEEAVIEIIKQATVGQGLVPTVEELRQIITNLETALGTTNGNVIPINSNIPAE